MHLWDRCLDFWYGLDKGYVLLALLAALLAGVGFGVVHLAQTGHARTLAEQQRRNELRCLAENVYYEARGEPEAGRYAVAEVTLNRVASPGFPDSVCAVVHQRRLDPVRRRYVGAFSWTETAQRRPYGAAWNGAVAVATASYDARQPARVPGALYYHARSVKPRWAAARQPLTTIGNHVFYE